MSVISAYIKVYSDAMKKRVAFSVCWAYQYRGVDSFFEQLIL